MSLDEMEVVHAPEASALPLTSLVPRDEATFCYEDYVDKYEKTEEEAQEDDPKHCEEAGKELDRELDA